MDGRREVAGAFDAQTNRIGNVSGSSVLLLWPGMFADLIRKLPGLHHFYMMVGGH